LERATLARMVKDGAGLNDEYGYDPDTLLALRFSHTHRDACVRRGQRSLTEVIGKYHVSPGAFFATLAAHEVCRMR